MKRKRSSGQKYFVFYNLSSTEVTNSTVDKLKISLILDFESLFNWDQDYDCSAGESTQRKYGGLFTWIDLHAGLSSNI